MQLLFAMCAFCLGWAAVAQLFAEGGAGQLQAPPNATAYDGKYKGRLPINTTYILLGILEHKHR